jgi:hypothetical protein
VEGEDGVSDPGHPSPAVVHPGRLLQFTHIGTGTERATGPADHQHPTVGGLELDKRLAQRFPTVGGDGIPRLGPVQDQPANPAQILDVEPPHAGERTRAKADHTECAREGDSLTGMGFNPFRPATRSPIDLAMVALAVAAAIAGLIWALTG